MSCVWGLCEWSAGDGRQIQSLGLPSPGASLPSLWVFVLFCFVFVYLLNYQFIVKPFNQKQPEGRGAWGKVCGKRFGASMASSMPLSPNLHLFTNPEALSSFLLWNSTYPSTANTTEQPSLLLPSRHLCALDSAHWSFYLFSSLFIFASPNITLQVRKSVINFRRDMPKGKTIMGLTSSLYQLFILEVNF